MAFFSISSFCAKPTDKTAYISPVSYLIVVKYLS